LQPPSLSGTWKIDPAHSNINFAIRHLGINMIRGRFDTFAGTIVADPADLAKSSVEVTIQTASIDTDIAARDNHLRTPEFLDVEKYPQITFKSTRVEKGEGGGFVARGSLTMHGASRDISLPFRVGGPVKDSRAGTRIGIEFQVRLNRQDYGINYDQFLDGILALANDVEITIGLEAIPAR
jgi:polyisoprenoid-binding protein YceI